MTASPQRKCPLATYSLELGKISPQGLSGRTLRILSMLTSESELTFKHGIELWTNC